MSAPTWFTYAKGFEGLAEIKGPKHSSVITGWLDKLGAWWRDDEAPWCGVFVAQAFNVFGYPIPKYFMRAKAWLDWGVRVREPVLGCVVVFERKGGGHVGFVAGRDTHGNLWVLGGNQGNKVSIALFDRKRVLGYRIPKTFDYRLAEALPLYANPLLAGSFSKNEA